MPRPSATAPIPTGKKAHPWKFTIPEDVRHLHDGRKERYFAKRGDCLQFIGTLRRQRTEHTAAFNDLSDAVKAGLHEAHQTLLPYPDARSIPELAKIEADRLDAAARSKLLAPLIEELVAEKKADKRRERYTTGLRVMLNVFAAKFPDRLASSFSGAEIAKWLRDSYSNPNSRDSYRATLSVLFSWAKAKGYVASNPVAETKAVNARREEEVPILSPEQLNKLFTVAHNRLRPYLALGAFAAIRPGECRRIAWSNIDPQGIYVPKAAAKTVSRLVPIVPALAAWLAHFGPQTGRVYPGGEGTWRKDFRAATLKAGFPAGTWAQDAIRHSAISYWLAVEPNRAAVAKWSANSEAVQREHYDNPRSPEEAAAWFAVLPTAGNTPNNVYVPHRKGGKGKGQPIADTAL